MPRLRIQQNVEVDSRSLHSKYRHANESNRPDWLWLLPPDRRREIEDLRNRAFYLFIEEVALQDRREKDRPRLIAELRSFGGRLARHRGRQGSEREIRAISHEIDKRRSLLARRRRPFAHADEAQYCWHRAIVLAHEFLRAAVGSRRLGAGDFKRLRGWFSIPEIRLRCTRDTIKAARRRFVYETRNDRQYRVYTTTPRSATPAVSCEFPRRSEFPSHTRPYEPDPEYSLRHLEPALEDCERCHKPLDEGDHSICEIMLDELRRGGNPDGVAWDELRGPA